MSGHMTRRVTLATLGAVLLIPSMSTPWLVPSPLADAANRQEASILPGIGGVSAAPCASSTLAVTPCDPTVSASAGGRNAAFAFRIEYGGSSADGVPVTCVPRGFVPACRVSTPYLVAAGRGKTQTDTAYFDVAPIVQSGTGAFTISVGGASTTVEVAISPLNACLPADAWGGNVLTSLRQLSTDTAWDAVAVRDSARLPLLTPGAPVTLVASGVLCSRASAAYDSLRAAYNGTPRDPYRKVYLFQWGPFYLVGDHNVMSGEWFPMAIFDSVFTYQGGLSI